MFYQLTEKEVLALFNEQDLSKSEIGVFLWLKTKNPFGDKEINISASALGDILGFSRTSVSRALKRLSDLGIISLEIVQAKVRVLFPTVDTRISNDDTHFVDSEIVVEVESTPSLATTPNTKTSGLTLTTTEHGLLKDIEKLAWNPCQAPWHDGVLFKDNVIQAVYDSNPSWYSTGNGAINTKKIDSILRSLERKLKQGGIEAIKSYNELMGYCSMRKAESTQEQATYPDGPWMVDGKINEDFVRDRATIWRTGDSPTSKSFGAMAIEDVMGMVCSHYIRNTDKLNIDWNAYVAKSHRYVSNVQQRLSNGISIPEEERQRVLAKAPAILNSAVDQPYSTTRAAISPAVCDRAEPTLLPPSPQTDTTAEDVVDTEQLEEARRRINSLIKNKGMALKTFSLEEQQQIKDQEKSRKIAHWNSLLQCGIPSVIKDVERQVSALGYQVVDGRVETI